MKILANTNEKRTLDYTNPELVEEWHPDKNGCLDPSDVTSGSHKKVWWKCSRGHEWEAKIYHRSAGSSCPYCSGRKAIPGETDLETTYPDLATEWDFARNKGLTPKDVTKHSGKTVWWICEKGHSWAAVIYSRSAGCGCPYCTGQKVKPGENDIETTNPDLAAEWDFKKNKGLTPKDVTEHSSKRVWWICKKGHSWTAVIYNRSVGKGCPYCVSQKVISGENDLQTTNPELAAEWDFAKNKGVTPKNVAVYSHKRVWWRCKKGHSWTATVNSRAQGNGCPYCSGRKAILGETDLGTINPELATEWDFTRNLRSTPSDVTSGSHKKAWWRCQKGHSWTATIKSRTEGNSCPYCSGRKAILGETDLGTINPELAAEWDFARNKGLTPEDVTTHSGKRVWWKCRKGHSWTAVINSRAQGNGCPYCSGKKAILGETDLGTTNPELAAEWDLTRNKELTPSDVTSGSHKKVWWKCKKGHSWAARIYSRSTGSGCPFCAGKKQAKDG